MQPKPEHELDHDIMDSKAEHPSLRNPNLFDCVFLFANKAKVTLVTATRGCFTITIHITRAISRKGLGCIDRTKIEIMKEIGIISSHNS